jgi:L-ascorbate metabolism protein UlaG (beta-lactamase superfamily)
MSIALSRKKGNKFVNTIPTEVAGYKNFIPILWQYIINKAENTPKRQLGPFITDIATFKTPPETGLRITWVGHSSLLIEIDERTILTDPVWSARVSFSSFIGPKRFFPAPLPLHHLPKIDAVIISHDHYDHLDKNTIKYFAATETPFYCSLGIGKYLKKWGIQEFFIHEMDWGDSAMVDHDCVITATPARHFSGRGITNRDQTLWSSFVIKGSKHNIFFGADSGWTDQFQEIGDTYGPFDLTMLEIGAYGDYWPDIHMGPINAGNAYLALRGKLMMPIHWGTFNLAPHAWYEPAERLNEYAFEKQLQLFMPQPGEPTDVTGKAYNSEWWKKYR